MSDLERFGLEWTGPQDFIAKPMPDGYWTPWHIAAERIAKLEGLGQIPRNPTDEMIQAGYGALPDCKCTEGMQWRAKLVWQAMYDSALAGKGGGCMRNKAGR